MKNGPPPDLAGAPYPEALRRLAATLGAGGVEDAWRCAEWLLRDVLGCSRARLLASDAAVAPGAAALLAAAAARRIAGEPLQYITGKAGFYGLELAVTPDVLIPRPETEVVVEEALSSLPPGGAALDIGTGSGCIALALGIRRPDAAVWGCDVSAAALDVARGNAAALGVNVVFVAADLRAEDFAGGFGRCFDLVVSNPPYIPLAEEPTLPPEVARFEPRLALFSGDDPLYFYRLLGAHARLLLRPGGRLVLETHMDYADAVADLLRATGYADVRRRDDLAGRPRVVSARLHAP